MRIQSFNSAISSVAKTARNTVAAAMVAASPMAAKTAAAVDPAPLAKTNVADVVSFRLNDPTSIGGIYYLQNVPTNSLPTKVDITSFKPKSSSKMTMEVVANGWIPAAEIQSKNKLTDSEWTVFDSVLTKDKGSNFNFTPEANTATKFSVEIPKEAAESKFFRVVVPGFDESGKFKTGFSDSNPWLGIWSVQDAATGETVKIK